MIHNAYLVLGGRMTSSTSFYKIKGICPDTTLLKLLKPSTKKNLQLKSLQESFLQAISVWLRSLLIPLLLLLLLLSVINAISRKKLFSTNSSRRICLIFTIKWKVSRKKSFQSLSKKSLKSFSNADFFLMVS